MVLEELSNALISNDFAIIEGGAMNFFSSPSSNDSLLLHLNPDQCKIAPGQEHSLNKVFSDAKPLVALVNTKLDRLDHSALVLSSSSFFS